MILAVIGVGKWGKNILATLEKIPDAGLKYLCSENPATLAEFSSRYQKISGWQNLLAQKDVQGVLIATPPATHFEIAAAFIKKKISVFLEKPMVLSGLEALKLSAIVKKNKTVFMVGYQYVYNDYVAYIKKQIETGAFGKILSIKSEHVLSPARQNTSVFWDAAPHPLSIIRYLFTPKKIPSVEGTMEYGKTAAQIVFENAPTLELFESYAGARKIRKTTVVGEKITAILDETLEKNKLAVIANRKTSYPEINARQPLQNELEHFLRCAKTGETPRTDINFGCAITEWLEDIEKKFAQAK